MELIITILLIINILLLTFIFTEIKTLSLDNLSIMRTIKGLQGSMETLALLERENTYPKTNNIIKIKAKAKTEEQLFKEEQERL